MCRLFYGSDGKYRQDLLRFGINTLVLQELNVNNSLTLPDQVVNGILRRAQADAEIKLHLSPKDAKLMKPGSYVRSPVPIAHIPAGTQNGLAYSITGTTEPSTGKGEVKVVVEVGVGWETGLVLFFGRFHLLLRHVILHVILIS